MYLYIGTNPFFIKILYDQRKQKIFSPKNVCHFFLLWRMSINKFVSLFFYSNLCFPLAWSGDEQKIPIYSLSSPLSFPFEINIRDKINSILCNPPFTSAHHPNWSWRNSSKQGNKHFWLTFGWTNFLFSPLDRPPSKTTVINWFLSKFLRQPVEHFNLRQNNCPRWIPSRQAPHNQAPTRALLRVSRRQRVDVRNFG